MATVPEWTPRHRSGFPRPRCLPSTRLACPHPRVRPGCPALSCLQSHMPGAVLGPSWPLALPSQDVTAGRPLQPRGLC